MAFKGTQFTSKAAATANRLRSIQIDFADQPQEDRERYLNETIQSALSDLAQDERQAFLKELEERFPTWDDSSVVQRAQAGTKDTTTNENELKDPSFLVRRLIELGKGMSEADRRAQIIEPLAKAGLSKVGEAGLPPEPMEDLKKEMRIPVDRKIDPTRLLRLLTSLYVSMAKLDPVIRGVWKSVGGDSERSIRFSSTPMQERVRQALIKEEGSVDKAVDDIENLRSMIAALLSSISQVAGKFANGNIARLRPDEVEAVAIHEKRVLENLATASWKKYKEDLAPEYLPATKIEKEINRIIVEFTVNMRGKG